MVCALCVCVFMWPVHLWFGLVGNHKNVTLTTLKIRVLKVKPLLKLILQLGIHVSMNYLCSCFVNYFVLSHPVVRRPALCVSKVNIHVRLLMLSHFLHTINLLFLVRSALWLVFHAKCKELKVLVSHDCWMQLLLRAQVSVYFLPNGTEQTDVTTSEFTFPTFCSYDTCSARAHLSLSIFFIHRLRRSIQSHSFEGKAHLLI